MNRNVYRWWALLIVLALATSTTRGASFYVAADERPENDGVLPDSIEDHEYLAILELLDKAAEAEKIVLPVAQSWFGWEKEPDAYETARTKLAEMIIAIAKPPQ